MGNVDDLRTMIWCWCESEYADRNELVERLAAKRISLIPLDQLCA
jgi:hypothetical protein